MTYIFEVIIIQGISIQATILWLFYDAGCFFTSAGIMGGMLSTTTFTRKPLIWLLLLVLTLSACSNNPTPVVEDTPTMAAPTVTSIPEEPTPTLIPAAAVVNGERIPLSWFEQELERYLLAQEAAEQPQEDQALPRETVLNDLIDQVLLAQAARENGLNVDDDAVQARVDTLASEVDLAAWMTSWGYTEEELKQSLKLQMLAANQRDFILETIPEIQEQVELQQVFAYTEEGAKRALVSLNSGRPFEEVAFDYDPTTGGYLGWAPRGYLLIPDVEQAVFNLEVGGYSEVIESEIGYHILMVLSREERALSPDARLTLQRQALHDWLSEQREISEIEVLID